MLSFATEFPVERGKNSDDFLNALRKWLLGSPHTTFNVADLEGLHAPREWKLTKDDESLETLRVQARADDTTGVRYMRRGEGLDWTTTVVFSRSSADSWVGIRVSRESSHPAVRLPTARKPRLVRTLLEELGGSSDGMLRVGNEPFRLENPDIDMATAMIDGRAQCRLPIVYVSAGFHGDYTLDPDRLAADLAGMSHVVVEPNRAFSLRLRIEVDSENVYGGTIGVYWPDGNGRRSFFMGAGFEGPDDLCRAIVDEIRTALTNRRVLDRCTWAFLQEAVSRLALEELRSSGSKEVDKYVESFDRELTAKNQRLEDAEKEIARLRMELRVYEARMAAGTGSLLRTGVEQDLYPNEVYRIVRDAVEDAQSRVSPDSRRLHVINAILKANPAGEDVAGSKREQLKELLRAFRGLETKTRRGLESLGFAIVEDGRHYKLVFQGDDRYTFALPRSGSDYRGGLNAASDIARLLF